MVHEVSELADQFEKYMSGQRCYIVVTNIDEYPREFNLGDYIAINEVTDELVAESQENVPTGRSLVTKIVDIDDCFIGQDCLVVSLEPYKILRGEWKDIDYCVIDSRKR